MVSSDPPPYTLSHKCGRLLKSLCTEKADFFTQTALSAACCGRPYRNVCYISLTNIANISREHSGDVPMHQHGALALYSNALVTVAMV
jgi:hypothetical protein